ncbi:MULTISPECIES: DUF1640 domain-containing protein [Burkholderiaceae]|uniref:DUF1640 domain-containing protein n=1 Tax=Burkholderiaceae TaxID=119060 RepID=UPI000963A421|nr:MULTISPECIES: DUF1640 domain-containing protein [Burkholderiaceae]MCF2133893.1 CCDC90 family protein [Mycetohabitans sp. B3]MCG1018592.1 CCDC90 family protein [Mycetohabitans sp. B4]SIT75656.1 Protein of unknown function [Burkholderia sp. b13]SIT75864.1 Protein of unknown function [Burkholderia sp. b13]
MAAIAFDTLKFANRLKTAGVPPAQAEAEAEVFADIFEANFDALATKADLRELEMRLDAKVDKGFAEVRGEIDKRFAEFRGELDKRFAEVRGELDKRFAEAKGEALLLKWMLGVTVASTTSLLIRSFF